MIKQKNCIIRKAKNFNKVNDLLKSCDMDYPHLF